MRISLSALCFMTYFVGCESLTRYISHIQNYVNLVSAYNLDGYSTIDFPPLADVSQVMTVNIDMHLYAVNGFDEVAGNIELVVALEMSWLDEMSIIQSISFKIEDRAEFLVPYDMIWTPKIILTNAIGATSDVGDSAYLCRFDMATKRISWRPRVVVSGSCTPDVTFYPFDKQECDFIYTAWGFKADEILLTTNSDAWSLAEYGESGEWDIDSTSTTTYTQNEQSYIKFTIVMVRKPLYFAFNILLPILVLCLLNSTVFLLPAESGERVGFSVTCFLSFMVLLNMIMDIMPRSSNPISFLCYYLVVMMANSGAMTLVTILLMRVYHKPEKSVVPKWMQRAVTFVNCGCARLRCCVLCCRFLRRKCCCEDQRKCGCKNKKGEKTMSEATLIEITVDKDQNVIEKPMKERKSKNSSEKEVNESSKCCCIISCLRNNDTSNNKCCCGCILGCKKCKKNDEHKSKDSSNTEKEMKSKSSSCFSCFRKRKRITEGDNDGVSCDDDSAGNKKFKSEVNTVENTCCFSIIRSKNENAADDGKTDIESRPGCFGRKDKKVKKLNKTEECSIRCFSKKDSNTAGSGNDSEKKKCERNDGGNNKCFGFLRKAKVSTLDTTDSDIEDDEMPVSTRSEGSKTLKISFKGKNELDTEETLLKRWEDATKGTTNKKGNPLNPIEEKINGEELPNEDAENNEGEDVTLKTKSIRASIKEKEARESEKSKSDNNDDTDVNLEIVRKSRSKRASVKENLPKPVEHEKVIPQTRSKSKVETVYTEEDSDEGDVDSLADLEEEVTWPEVGRILDTFFFLAFAGGQAFLTVVFLVPLFTGDTKNSDS